MVVVTPEKVTTLCQSGKDMKICTFLWVYYGYPTSSYEGMSVEKMRYNCGRKMAQRDRVKADIVAVENPSESGCGATVAIIGSICAGVAVMSVAVVLILLKKTKKAKAEGGEVKDE